MWEVVWFSDDEAAIRNPLARYPDCAPVLQAGMWVAMPAGRSGRSCETALGLEVSVRDDAVLLLYQRQKGAGAFDVPQRRVSLEWRSAASPRKVAEGETPKRFL